MWKFGLWKRKTKTSPLALWVATSRSAAMDRASPKRGYAAQQSTLPSEWDCPVAIGLNLPAELFGNGGHKPLKNGVERKRMLAGGRREMPVEELNIVEVDFFAPAFERYRILSALWPSLKSRERVLCRCEVGNPGKLFQGGHGAPWTCGRTLPRDDCESYGWLKANNTSEWRCPSCDRNKRLLLGSITGEP